MKPRCARSGGGSFIVDKERPRFAQNWTSSIRGELAELMGYIEFWTIARRKISLFLTMSLAYLFVFLIL